MLTRITKASTRRRAGCRVARVFVAMSGGVDSSVAAALLCESGHEVVGVTMQIWPSTEDEGGCCSVSAVRDAKRVCDQLGVAHYVLNFRDVFEREVIEYFAREYARGRTPNPCIVCNDVVKFGELLGRVTIQGADALATGHYARIEARPGGSSALRRGVDPAKDQSYFLYRLAARQMRHVMFPVGGLTKSEVRSHATRLGLTVAHKPESQEVCFAHRGQHARVTVARRPETAAQGEIVDERGRVLGTHAGIAHYTIGQRHGLGLGGGQPRFVVAIDAKANRVVVGAREALARTRVLASAPVWHGEPVMRVAAATRYRMSPIEGVATYSAGSLVVELDQPVEGVAPGQAIVCYEGDRVVGGGVIECAD